MNWKFWKKYTCNHDYEYVRNLYGDEINYYNGKRSVWKCSKCGKIEFRDYLYEKPAYLFADELRKLYEDYYDKRYKDWQESHSEDLNMLRKKLRDTAYNGRRTYDIVMLCDVASNDKEYYYKWLTEQGLKVSTELFNQKEWCTEKNSYLFKIYWK